MIVSAKVNGEAIVRAVDDRRLLADFLREDLELTATKLGCEQGVCGACTVLVGGEAVRSCLMFAAQVDGGDVVTVEGLAASGELNRLQDAFHRHHALQCGFCTAGFLVSSYAFLRDAADPSADDVRVALSGNLCRCTGYQGLVAAVAELAADGGRDSAA